MKLKISIQAGVTTTGLFEYKFLPQELPFHVKILQNIHYMTFLR